jgi:serine/threonine protein kinase
MEDLTGKQFGAYEIVAPLGEGGMAAVYKAYQPAMERFVAVKVLSRTLVAESNEFTNRFQREAIMLAQLQHPHILPVFDYGQKDGYSYIVMPFLQNGTLAELLQARRRTLPEIHQIMTQIGGALGYAHARGMIHRDVKPSNVLIDEQGNCLLTDFGLARMMQASSDRLTSAGTIMGTPAYMSPEQGKGDSVDGRSDLYSLGIIFYEMLTGRVPYQDNFPMMVVIKHIRDPLPSVRELAPELNDAIERVVIKSLAKETAERYQTAEDFVQAVNKAIQVNLPGRAVSKAMDSVYDRLLMKDRSTRNEATSAKGTDDASPPSDEQTFISPRPSKDIP